MKENKHLNVILSPASEDLEEVTVVAFGQQKKESVVSAITTVRPMDLKSSNSDLTSSFAGKIAGKEKSIEKVVFDRNGYLYHGKIKAVADGAREGGLEF